jgi:hypothetical protein
MHDGVPFGDHPQARHALLRDVERLGGRTRRVIALATVLAAFAALVPATLAGTSLGGTRAPDWVRRQLAFQVQHETSQQRSVIGAPIAAQAITAAALDSTSIVWGAPTDNGGYCVGLTRPRQVSGFGCSTQSAGMISSYVDCDTTVVVGGRIPRVARATARSIELRRAGHRLQIAIQPVRNGFFIGRVPGSFFAGVQPHARATWARFQVVDAQHRVIAPANVTGGPLPPPNAAAC